MAVDYKWSDLPRWLRCVCAVAYVNFALFVAISFASGGDAFNGKEVEGRYFISNHGHDTEVSKAFYYYSYAHAISVISLMIICMTSIVLVKCFRKKFKK